MRAPLIVRSVIEGQRYRTALVVLLIGSGVFALMAFDVLRPPPTILAVAGLLVVYAPLSAANVFLGYPRLFLSGNRLTIWTNPLWPARIDLSPYGAAYAVHHSTRTGLATFLAFRTAADEAAHRAAEKYPFAPDYAEAAKTIDIGTFVGAGTARAEALAAEINAHRGLG